MQKIQAGALSVLAASLIAALCSVFVIVAPSRAAMIPGSQFTYNRWNGAGWTDDHFGGFSHCVVSSTYVDGTTLLFSVNAAQAVTIGFARPDWKFNPGQEVQATLRIDQRYSSQVSGVAYLPTALKVDFLSTDPIFADLAHGYVLTVTSPIGSASYRLVDSFRALQKAQQCATTYAAKLGPARANNELQKWIARNPWFSNPPQYGSQIRTTMNIDAQMRAEGKDPATAAYYDELDKRLHDAGINLGNGAQPVATTTVAPPAAESRPKPKTVQVSGSGFVVTADGYVVTNNHVVNDCIGDVKGNLPGEAALILRIVSTDVENDMAVLKATGTFTNVATIRDTAIHPGDPIIAIGYPYYGVLSSDFTVTNGIVSSLGGIGNDSRFLQISAPVQSGNSGGPLLDTYGNVVGIVSEKLDAIKFAKMMGSIPENVNFAIKTGMLRDFLDKNAVGYQPGRGTAELKTADIAARARSYVMHVWCLAGDSEQK